MPSAPGETIGEFMTPAPATVQVGQTLAQAHALMRRKRIRHLPVLARETLVGIVSIHDLHLLETLKDVDPEAVTVEEAMTRRPYAVSPGAPLERVVRQMAARKLGSAVVVEKGKVVGVFTTTDALRHLSRLLAMGGRKP